MVISSEICKFISNYKFLVTILNRYNKNADWRRTFLHHVKLAIELHNITKIIIIDHENCGPYKLYKNEYENEYEYHCINIKKCAKSLIKLFPNISVECYYLKSNDESINIFR
jgi:carbonic anhydrase